MQHQDPERANFKLRDSPLAHPRAEKHPSSDIPMAGCRGRPCAGQRADCSWKRALRTQFGQNIKTPAAPCVASGEKPPAPGAPIPRYKRFSPPEAARAADKFLLHSRRGLGRAAGATNKMYLLDARVPQSRRRVSSGENSPRPDHTAGGSSRWRSSRPRRCLSATPIWCVAQCGPLVVICVCVRPRAPHRLRLPRLRL